MISLLTAAIGQDVLLKLSTKGHHGVSFLDILSQRLPPTEYINSFPRSVSFHTFKFIYEKQIYC